jgi:hypothetical protein
MSRTPETGQPARKRRWFQFHLSTAIVLMFVASALLWLNLRQSIGYEDRSYVVRLRGWPVAFIYEHYWKPFPEWVAEPTWVPWGLTLDLGVGVGVLFLMFVLVEKVLLRGNRRVGGP